MANSKSRARTQAQQRARAQAKKAAGRGAPAVLATPNSPARQIVRPRPVAVEPEPEVIKEQVEPEAEAPAGPPRWFPWATFALAIIGLGISIYETYAHFNGNHLLGCAGGAHSAVNCTAVITSSQSMVFGVIPVAILGLAFYVAAVPLFSPWGWRLRRREAGLLRLASVVVGMGFVVYLIYAEVYQIGSICEYCTGVHVVTFLLFCMTVCAAALWGLGQRGDAADAS